jgi:hypothetical protein
MHGRCGCRLSRCWEITQRSPGATAQQNYGGSWGKDSRPVPVLAESDDDGQYLLED